MYYRIKRHNNYQVDPTQYIQHLNNNGTAEYTHTDSLAMKFYSIDALVKALRRVGSFDVFMNDLFSIEKVERVLGVLGKRRLVEMPKGIVASVSKGQQFVVSRQSPGVPVQYIRSANLMSDTTDLQDAGLFASGEAAAWAIAKWGEANKTLLYGTVFSILPVEFEGVEHATVLE